MATIRPAIARSYRRAAGLCEHHANYNATTGWFMASITTACHSFSYITTANIFSPNPLQTLYATALSLPVQCAPFKPTPATSGGRSHTQFGYDQLNRLV